VALAVMKAPIKLLIFVGDVIPLNIKWESAHLLKNIIVCEFG